MKWIKRFLILLLVLAIGVVIVVSKAKKLEAPVPTAAGERPPPIEEDPYLARVRELVEKP